MKIFKFASVIASVLIPFCGANAGDLIWSGKYRLEGTSVFNGPLNDSRDEKSYILHHLILEPRIVAADTVNIFSRLDIFNDTVSTIPGAQYGEFFGARPGCGGTCDSVAKRAQPAGSIAVNQMYLRWTPFEFGMFLAGRVPMHFGLGMTHNAGLGLYDHWSDTKDLIGYKFILGNFSVFPMYGKVKSSPNHDQADISDLMVQVQWDNPETDISIGFMYESRFSTPHSNDINPTNVTTAATETYREGWSGKQMNIFVKKNYENSKLGLEAGFQSGKTGVVVTGSREEVALDGYGLAAEYSYVPKDARLKADLKAGMASGQEPNQKTKYSGFFFNRNYDVALLMFNHFLGPNTSDISGSKWYTGGSNASVDTETVSNAWYLSPGVDYALSDSWTARGRITTGALMQVSNASLQKGLGMEYDLGLEHIPFERMSVRADMGIFVPGDAYTIGGVQGKTSFGFFTRAAVSF